MWKATETLPNLTPVGLGAFLLSFLSGKKLPTIHYSSFFADSAQCCKIITALTAPSSHITFTLNNRSKFFVTAPAQIEIIPAGSIHCIETGLHRNESDFHKDIF